MGLLRHSVLVSPHGAGGAVRFVSRGRGGGAKGCERLRIGCIDGWDERQVVLEFVEVLLSCSDGAIEGIVQRRVEWSERKFVDVVREVEGCPKS